MGKRAGRRPPRPGGERPGCPSLGERHSGDPLHAVGSVEPGNDEAGGESVLSRQRAAVHLVGDQDVGPDARDRKVFSEGL